MPFHNSSMHDFGYQIGFMYRERGIGVTATISYFNMDLSLAVGPKYAGGYPWIAYEG